MARRTRAAAGAAAPRREHGHDEEVGEVGIVEHKVEAIRKKSAGVAAQAEQQQGLRTSGGEGAGAHELTVEEAAEYFAEDGEEDVVEHEEDEYLAELEADGAEEATPALPVDLAAASKDAVLDMILVQASKFAEFVNSSLATSAAPPASATTAAASGVPVAAGLSSPAKRTRSSRSAAPTSPVSSKKARPAGAKSVADVAGGSLEQPSTFRGSLRPYQLEGYAWLSKLYENGVNGILADEMGLGKTVQIIALLAHLREGGVSGPVLIVAPLSTLPNWVREFGRFVPSISTVKYHGTAAARTAIRRSHPFSQDHVWITSYEMAMKDRKFLANADWLYVIVDEGHRLKNMNCRLIRELKRYRSQNRLLLTGTPLQNNIIELWSLLNFLLPDIFDDVNKFAACFQFDVLDAANSERVRVLGGCGAGGVSGCGVVQSYALVSKLHEIVRPFLLRRVKSEVCMQLPPKVEVILYPNLAQPQTKLYNGILEGDSTRVLTRMGWSTGVEGVRIPNASLNILMHLRKCVNHPFLFAEPPTAAGAVTDEAIVACCGKMQLLDRMLPRLKAAGHKVLIFSQMTGVLDILEDYLEMRRLQYCRIDGGVGLEDREAQIDAFNTDSNMFIFLLSTRAGGLGINLTAADTVILYDSDWNPHQDSQAQDRCHRIGQERPVVVYRFITRNSVEVKMMTAAANKRVLERIMIERGAFESRTQVEGVSAHELRSLLKDDLAESVQRQTLAVIADVELRQVLNRTSVLAAVAGEPGAMPLEGKCYAIVQKAE